MSETQQLIESVRTAYADAIPQRDDAGFSHDMRSLHFVTDAWLTPDVAEDAVDVVGPYNYFEPETMHDLIDAVEAIDHDARFAVGREGSPVLYIKTVAGLDVAGSISRSTYAIDEFSVLDVDTFRAHVEDLENEGPSVESGYQYVRMWWD